MSTEKILITGANGQIGSALTLRLAEIYGAENVLTTDLSCPVEPKNTDIRCEALDVLDKFNIHRVLKENKITQIFHLAAFLSVKAEGNPQMAWKVNMEGLLNVLEACKLYEVKRLFWPSSIAVFGPTSPKQNTPQNALLEPTTVYGISKQAGERWCERYFNKHSLDVRSIRYPGIISPQELTGGGTTDYAVDMYFAALKGEKYTCYLAPDTALPMMYMTDAIKATIDIMLAESDDIHVRHSYNVGAFSFTPEQLYQSIKKHVPTFEIEYQPDFRQAIADSWPDSANDEAARKDWNWSPAVNLDQMTEIMLKEIDALLKRDVSETNEIN